MRPSSETSTIGAIVLAAGRSSRMAPRNKLLELAGETPIVVCVATAALASKADPVIVVTGFEADRVEQALRDLQVSTVRNPAFAQGLSTSLRAGLGALPPHCDGALILLGDMPIVDVKVLNALIAAFTGPDAVYVPVFEGRRGNPVLWGRRYFAEILQLEGDTGAKQLLLRNTDRITEVPVESQGIFADVDTVADLARLGQTEE
jgi:molybdenum cofactor cytidylyltransferase